MVLIDISELFNLGRIAEDALEGRVNAALAALGITDPETEEWTCELLDNGMLALIAVCD